MEMETVRHGAAILPGPRGDCTMASAATSSAHSGPSPPQRAGIPLPVKAAESARSETDHCGIRDEQCQCNAQLTQLSQGSNSD